MQKEASQDRPCETLLLLTPPPNFLAEHPRNASDGEDGAWGDHAQAARARAVSFAQFRGNSSSSSNILPCYFFIIVAVISSCHCVPPR
jgi:hypothetical protein